MSWTLFSQIAMLMMLGGFLGIAAIQEWRKK